MGHYDDLYFARDIAAEREKRLAEAETLANDADSALKLLAVLTNKLKKSSYHQLAWERLQDIVNDLKIDPETAAKHSVAITHIETAILWLRR